MGEERRGVPEAWEVVSVGPVCDEKFFWVERREVKGPGDAEPRKQLIWSRGDFVIVVAVTERGEVLFKMLAGSRRAMSHWRPPLVSYWKKLVIPVIIFR